jgi:hypothetical protein
MQLRSSPDGRLRGEAVADHPPADRPAARGTNSGRSEIGTYLAAGVGFAGAGWAAALSVPGDRRLARPPVRFPSWAASHW